MAKQNTVRVKMTTSHTSTAGTWNEGVIYDMEINLAREMISRGFAIEIKE